MSQPWTVHRARLANLSKTHSPDDPVVVDEKRALRAACLESHVKRVLDEAPPLTDEQRTRLAGLFMVNSKRPQEAHADLGLTDHQSDQIGGDVE